MAYINQDGEKYGIYKTSKSGNPTGSKLTNATDKEFKEACSLFHKKQKCKHMFVCFSEDFSWCTCFCAICGHGLGAV